MRDIRSLKNISWSGIFEINQNIRQLFVHLYKILYWNAVYNITSAIDLLDPKNPEFDFKMENETVRILLNFLFDQLKYLMLISTVDVILSPPSFFALKVHVIFPDVIVWIKDPLA